MTETTFKKKFLDRVKDRFPGCEILRGNASTQQGMVDHIILYGPHWAGLEFKKSRSAKEQPNQDHFVKRLDDMSFGAFVYPENEEEVFDALEQAFTASRRTRISKS